MQQEPGPQVDPGVSAGRFFRVLAAIAVAGAAVFVAFRVFGGGDEASPPASAPATPAASASPPSDQRFPLQPGVTAEIIAGHNGGQRSRLTVGEVLDDFAHPSNQFQVPNPGSRWWGVYLTVENVGLADAQSLRYKLRLAGQSEYDPRYIAGVPDTFEYSYTDLTPGGVKRGWIFFEIPVDGEVDALRVDARNGAGGQPSPSVFFEAP